MKDIEIGQVWMIRQEDNPEKWKKGLIAKTRPMLVVGVHGTSTNCIPITSSEGSKDYNKVYHQLQNNDILLISQIRTISIDDHIQYMFNVTNDELRCVMEKLIDMFSLPARYNWYRPITRKHVINNNSPTPIIDLPKSVKTYILKNYTDYPMSELIRHFKSYSITKHQVYQIIHNPTYQ